MAVDSWKILSVTPSGAGPPFEQLNLMPKSLSGPPGLCDAVRMIPPKLGMRWKLDFRNKNIEKQ